MARKRLIILVLGFAILAAACGTSADAGEAQPADNNDNAVNAEVNLADTDLGSILVNGAGLTLYAFTDDTNGISTCYDDCASAWPPLTGQIAVGAGLDASTFIGVARDDGTSQVVTGGFPLYTFVGDGAPGDVTGQGSGGVWFVVSADGSLVTGAQVAAPADTGAEPAEAPAEVVVAGEIDGQVVLTDGQGYTLYAFTNDTNGVSNCNSPCSDTWPPVSTTDVVDIDSLRLTSVSRADGSAQLAVDGRPLYRYAGDEEPGDTEGQLVGGVWFAFNAEGDIIAPVGVRIGSTDAGDVLINAGGFTLYTFGKDEPGVSNCDSACSVTWPPVPGYELIDGSDVDINQFGTHIRNDGSSQLTLNGDPLYIYSGDEFPGDANGRGLGGGNWTTVDAGTIGAGNPAETIARAIADAPAEIVVEAPEADEEKEDDYGDAYALPEVTEGAVTSADSSLGQILVDAGGITLYAFTNDEDGVSNCNAACADAWPPVSGDTPVDGTQLDQGQFKVIVREDGTTQLAIGKWALYYFAGDSGPGDVNGQGSGDVWFAVAPDGSLVK